MKTISVIFSHCEYFHTAKLQQFNE